MRALICGVAGQDGAYLARLLLQKGYEVFGTSRDAQLNRFSNLETLGIRGEVNLCSMSLTDFRSVLSIVARVEPDEIYNLSGQSSVGLSFDQPVETFESVAVATLNLLEVVRFLNTNTRVYNAGSSECFGNSDGKPADEHTPFRPRSPYAVAKAASCWQIANYREAYELFACSGLLFNHESPLRAERFVTRKIAASATRIAAGSKETLSLGNIDIERDWGWAPEYVEAMWLMLQAPEPRDYVICTGETRSLRDFVSAAFEAVGLNWRDHVTSDESLMRPTDLLVSRGSPARAAAELQWRASKRMRDVVELMVAAERDRGATRQ
jgi:GDPmannose 4,6-dehydratase